ncbi:MAG: hypothetical protein HYW26_01300 [Candidatus Aenigmarchaeota archaeon]|nr:hypothetical protein [Candidatus Aenigmarchaeota archaeon]
MGYFEHSLTVKKEIESGPEMLNTARKAFTRQSEQFSFGGTVNLYRIGRTPSGLYVALRALRPDTVYGNFDREQQSRLMEIYCQNAERLHDEGKDVPAFCIGTVCGDSVGVITEDLTQGGQVELEHGERDIYGFVFKGDERRKVFVDIDWYYNHIPLSEIILRYFSEEHVMVL